MWTLKKELSSVSCVPHPKCSKYQNGLNLMNQSRDIPMEPLWIDMFLLTAVPRPTGTKYLKWTSWSIIAGRHSVSQSGNIFIYMTFPLLHYDFSSALLFKASFTHLIYNKLTYAKIRRIQNCLAGFFAISRYLCSIHTN